MSHQIDSFAYTNRLRSLAPSFKLGFAIALLLISLISSIEVQLLIAVWLSVWTVIYARIPAKLYLRLLALPLGFWFFSLPAFIISGVEANNIGSVQSDVYQNLGVQVSYFYLYVSQTGMNQVSSTLFRMMASTSCVYFILLTVPFTEVLLILRRSRCPVLLTELLLLMYRFIFSLLSIADELWTAQNARSGYRTWRRGMHSLGILVGQLLQRSLFHYRQVSMSLAARGFDGNLRVWRSSSYKFSRRYTIEAVLGFSFLILLNAVLHD